MAERRVHISEKGMRLDRFVRIHFPDVPFGSLSSLLKRGRLTVDGKRAKATDRLAAEAIVAIADPGPRTDETRRLPRAGDEATRAARLPREAAAAAPVEPLGPEDLAFLRGLVLHEDDDILVLDKPSGLAVHAGTRTDRDLDHLLARLVDERGERPVLVHRLDKDTSGLLVAAKSRAIAAVLGKAFATRAVEKEYRARVSGRPEPAKGRIEIPLVKVETPRGGRMVAAEPGAPGALAAATRYEVVGTADDVSDLALFPETGRQHQLRVHTRLIGHPILGDRLYDGRSAPRLMLHAYRIAFRHPRRGAVTFEAPLPADFR
jgi:RluA family pseudouridine synthase